MARLSSAGMRSLRRVSRACLGLGSGLGWGQGPGQGQITRVRARARAGARACCAITRKISGAKSAVHSRSHTKVPRMEAPTWLGLGLGLALG